MKTISWLVGISLSILFVFFDFNMGMFLFSSIAGTSEIFNIIGGLFGAVFGITLGLGMAADLNI